MRELEMVLRGSRVLVFLGSTLFLLAPAVSQGNGDYSATLARIPYAERFDHVFELLGGGLDPAIAPDALEDLRRLARAEPPDRIREAIPLVEAYRADLDPKGALFEGSYFVLADLYLQAQMPEVGFRLFEEAIAANVKPFNRMPLKKGDGLEDYLDSLRHGHETKLAVERYRYAFGERPDHYRERGDAIRMLNFDLLWKKKQSFVVPRDIVDPILSLGVPEPHRGLVIALGRALEGRAEDALRQLEMVDSALPYPPPNYNPQDDAEFLRYNENRNLPLYFILADVVGGKLDALEVDLEEFHLRNLETPIYTAKALTHIVRIFEHQPMKYQRGLLAVTRFLVESGFADPEGRGAALTPYARRHILDIHMSRLFRLGRRGEAKALAALIVENAEEIDPAAGNCILVLSWIFRDEGHRETAAELLTVLAGEPRWERPANSQLALLKMADGKAAPEDVECLVHSLDFAPPREEAFYGYEGVRRQFLHYTGRSPECDLLPEK